MGGSFCQLHNTAELTDLQRILRSQNADKNLHMLNILELAIRNIFPSSASIEFFQYFDDKNITKELKDPFVICIEKPNLHTHHGIIILAPDELSEELIQLLEYFIPWDEVNLISSISTELLKYIKPLCEKHHGDKIECLDGVAYLMEPNKALEYSEPKEHEEGIHAGKLGVENAEEISGNMPFLKIDPVRETIRNLESVGIFSNSKLASSAVLSSMGLINILFTGETFRRKGYGERVMSLLAKSIASLGITPMAEIEAWNHKSISCLEKVGFRLQRKVVWIYLHGNLPS